MHEIDHCEGILFLDHVEQYELKTKEKQLQDIKNGILPQLTYEVLN